MVFTFSVLERAYPFWANLVKKKSEFSVQTKIWYLDKFESSKFNGGSPFLVKFGSKTQNC